MRFNMRLSVVGTVSLNCFVAKNKIAEKMLFVFSSCFYRLSNFLTLTVQFFDTLFLVKFLNR